MSTTVARLQGVRKRYGDVVAVDGLDLDVRAGEVVGLLGPNGSGKTTTLSMLAGLRRPDEGKVELLGGDPARPATRRRLGVTPQEHGFPDALRVGEIVDLVRAHFPRPRDAAGLMAAFGLEGYERRRASSLSGGEGRKLAVALAFAGDPELVLLDEPTTGLDIDARHDIWRSIREYVAGGGTILLTSHYMEEVEALAQRIAVIAAGKLVTQGTVTDIRRLADVRRVSFRAASVPDLPGVQRSEALDGRHALYTRDADALVRALVSSGAPFRDLEVTDTSLEDAFLAITREAV